MLRVSRRLLAGSAVLLPLSSPVAQEVSQQQLQRFASCGAEVGVLVPSGQGNYVVPKADVKVAADMGGETRMVALALTKEAGKVDLCVAKSGNTEAKDAPACRMAKRMWRCLYTP